MYLKCCDKALEIRRAVGRVRYKVEAWAKEQIAEAEVDIELEGSLDIPNSDPLFSLFSN